LHLHLRNLHRALLRTWITTCWAADSQSILRRPPHPTWKWGAGPLLTISSHYRTTWFRAPSTDCRTYLRNL